MELFPHRDPHVFVLASQARDFVLAGRAVVTLVSQKTGNRFTYKIRRKKTEGQPADCWFVQKRTNSEEHGNYQYVGWMKADMQVKTSAKSTIPATDPSFKAVEYALRWLGEKNELPPNVEMWHEGCCGRCGRALTDPVSIARGIGPECIKKVGGV